MIAEIKRVPPAQDTLYSFIFLNRSEFPATFIELNAIAASAIAGCSNPKTASGIATTL